VPHLVVRARGCSFVPKRLGVGRRFWWALWQCPVWGTKQAIRGLLKDFNGIEAAGVSVASYSPIREPQRHVFERSPDVERELGTGTLRCCTLHPGMGFCVRKPAPGESEVAFCLNAESGDQTNSQNQAPSPASQQKLVRRAFISLFPVGTSRRWELFNLRRMQ
jgi:hypothetical protein